ncbi:unnamed protein product, partial [marine sediment metagenome]
IEKILRQRRVIEEKRQAEEELRASEEKYRNLSENIKEIIYRADPDTYVATYVNNAIEEIYGYTAEEWLSDPNLWEKAIHPEDKERVLAILSEALKKGEGVVYEYRIVTKENAVLWVEDRFFIKRDAQGKPISINGLVYNITERKQTEHQLRERMKELRAFYRLAEITEREGISQDELYQEFTNILPQSWQYPEIACARIMIGDSEFCTENFAESSWKQSAPVKVHESVVGRIEVGYLE